MPQANLNRREMLAVFDVIMQRYFESGRGAAHLRQLRIPAGAVCFIKDGSAAVALQRDIKAVVAVPVSEYDQDWCVQTVMGYRCRREAIADAASQCLRVCCECSGRGGQAVTVKVNDRFAEDLEEETEELYNEDHETLARHVLRAFPDADAFVYQMADDDAAPLDDGFAHNARVYPMSAAFKQEAAALLKSARQVYKALRHEALYGPAQM
jgi:hypothetical protein